MTSMRMRGVHRLDSPERSDRQVITPSHRSCLEQSNRDPNSSDCDRNAVQLRRRKSAVTFDIDHEATQVSVQPLSDEDAGQRSGRTSPGDRFLPDHRRMSAPELPPIRRNGHASTGRTAYNNNNNSSSGGTLQTDHSSASFGERRGTNTQSPHSQRSSSPSLSNKVPPTSRPSTGSWFASSDQQSAIGSTSNVKLETLFEKNAGMTLDSPRTTTSVGGYVTHKAGKMPGVYKNNNNNSNVSVRQDKGVSRDAKGLLGRAKRGPQIHHSSSETQLASRSQISVGVRLPSRLGRSSTSSVNNTSHLNLTNTSSDQRLKERTKNFRNNEIDRGRNSITVNNGLSKKNLRGGTVNGMRKYSSTIALNTLNRTSGKEEASQGGDGTDEEEENEKRIIDWLIGVDEAEPPPDPEIQYADEPPQTDTALHVVYKGD